MVVMMLHKYSRAAVVHVTQLTHNGKTSKQGSTDLCANASMRTRHILHIHLIEDMTEEFHAMVVIDGHELVVLLLGNLMGDRLSVDDCCHAIEVVSLCVLLLLTLLITDWLNLDVIHRDLTTMLALTIPSFSFVDVIETLAIYMGNSLILWLSLY